MKALTTIILVLVATAFLFNAMNDVVDTGQIHISSHNAQLVAALNY